MTNDNEPFNQLLTEMFQAKVWGEVTEYFGNLNQEEQDEILSEFGKILQTYGASSKEMWNYFHSMTMKASRTYYLVETLGNKDSAKWDNALEELS